MNISGKDRSEVRVNMFVKDTFLYKLGGTAAFITLLLLILSIILFFIWPFSSRYNGVTEIFTMPSDNMQATFTALDLGYWIMKLIYIPIYLSLYYALRQVNELDAFNALMLGLVGIITLIFTRPMFEIFTHNNSLLLAEKNVFKGQFLAAGYELFIKHHGRAWHISMFLTAISQLISAFLMLRSNHFNKATAYLGIVAFSFACGFWIPTAGSLFMFLSMLTSMGWLFLLFQNFFRLTRIE